MSDNSSSYERPPIGINSLPFWFAGGGSVEASLPVVAELGFDSVEIWTDHLWWTGEDIYKKKLKELQTKRKNAKRKGTKGTQTKSLGDGNINSFKRGYKGEVKKKMTSHRSKN